MNLGPTNVSMNENDSGPVAFGHVRYAGNLNDGYEIPTRTHVVRSVSNTFVENRQQQKNSPKNYKYCAYYCMQEFEDHFIHKFLSAVSTDTHKRKKQCV